MRIPLALALVIYVLASAQPLAINEAEIDMQMNSELMRRIQRVKDEKLRMLGLSGRIVPPECLVGGSPEWQRAWCE